MKRENGLYAVFVNTKAPRRVSEFIKNLNTEPMLSNVMIVTTSPVGMNT